MMVTGVLNHSRYHVSFMTDIYLYSTSILTVIREIDKCCNLLASTNSIQWTDYHAVSIQYVEYTDLLPSSVSDIIFFFFFLLIMGV